ncbi:Crp/Fnr family transcriptional regulator [Kaistia dalseonensis]|uniref:CRP-like cAMP-binding protein n=1 Tax=Kaistia dalseonensis TaxID=410840 RepID=A0ABU0H1A4_9HYPH|nr:Crp/Fnr family transcriptional regulator [Kaistia dalseonensis]MCX5493528.1 Crp/Fnr family transcriptional regulator [Kaistia dalseonensis]MDQ0436088.1 CRP-like cAMP-binding protein [Kaistia dalseonensis]
MQIAEILSSLGRTSFFNGLDKDDLTRLAQIARLSTYGADTLLFAQGDESDGLYCVVSGIVRIFLTADDSRELTIQLFEEGEVIGEIALIDGLPRSAGAATLTESTLIFVPRQSFLNLLDSSNRLQRQIILGLCERLRQTNDQVNRAVFQDLRHRLLVLLRQLALIHGRIERDVAIVELDLTQGSLAQMLGASREAVNKQIRALTKEGRLSIDGHRILVHRSVKDN